ncbi:MAG: PA14 domain-containing protein [Candidatus Magnetoovum sp. WYHC-5]|nr:PA14 domain-containing protein [Candidatus Magnetoovum sp. WYHC-5]
MIIGLKAALPYMDEGFKSSAENKITLLSSYLKSIQKANGGWPGYVGQGSDALPAAHALYALSLAGVSASDEAARNGITYLVNSQQGDGSWGTQYVRRYTYPDDRFAATTWATISLPIALDTIIGIEASLTLKTPSNVTLNNPSITPTNTITDETGTTTYIWQFSGINDTQTTVLNMDLNLLNMGLNENRAVTSEAYVTFKNTYTGGQVVVPVDVPVILGTATANSTITTDKPSYTNNEDVSIATLIENISNSKRNLKSVVSIEDAGGNVVGTIGEFDVNGLEALWHHRIGISVTPQDAASNDIVDVSLNINSLLAIGGVNSTVYQDSIRVFEASANELIEVPSYYLGSSNKLIIYLEGDSVVGQSRDFYLYFDTTENDTKEKPSYNWRLNGLTGKYYTLDTKKTNVNSSNPNDIVYKELKLIREDGTISFNWGSGSPNASLPNDYFGAEWLGYIYLDVGGSYKLQTRSNDGSWVLLNNSIVVNNHGIHGMNRDITKQVQVDLESGFYALKVKMFDATSTSDMYFSWAKPYADMVIVPKDVMATPITATVEIGQLEVPALNKIEKQFIWNTEDTLTGDYLARISVYENEVFICEDVATFSITSTVAINTAITTDKQEYNPYDTVEIALKVENESANHMYENLSTVISISDGSGNLVYTQTEPISILVPGDLKELNTYFDISNSPQGVYSVNVQVYDGENVISTADTSFTVNGTQVTGVGIEGTITTEPAEIEIGGNGTITFTLTNSGNEDINTLTIESVVVSPETEEVKYTYLNTFDLLSKGANIEDSYTINTSEYEIEKYYLAILRVKTSTMGDYKTIVSDTFKVTKPQKSLEISKNVVDKKQVLVWLNYQWESGNSVPDVEQIKGALNNIGVDYHIVYDKKDFQNEQRNQLYTDFVILGEQDPIEDHYSEELKAQVYSGKGLISAMFNRQNLDETMFGIKVKGKLSGSDYLITMSESELSGSGQYQSYGKVLKVEALNSSDVVGTITEKKTSYPAALKRTYGGGKVVFYAFDLGKSIENYDWFKALLGNSIEYVHNSETLADTTVAGTTLPFELTIKAVGGDV